jgi:mono/diheme cytochrome c family protein
VLFVLSRVPDKFPDNRPRSVCSLIQRDSILRRLIVIVAFLAGILLAVALVVMLPASIAASSLAPHTPDLANGREMFLAGGCSSCHAMPGSDDRSRLGGGLGLKSPFGTFYVPNISPDPDDGIGKWSEADFLSALLRGTSPDGSHYFPAFPYTSYQRVKLDDARDLFAYLKTLPPVKQQVRDHDVRFPYNVRFLVGAWKFLYLDGKPFQPDSAQSAQWNRGAYLVNGPAHCAECHSPRDALGGIIPGKRFTGGPNLEGEGWVPNITQKELSDYEVDDFAYLLETGRTLTESVSGPMRDVIRNTSQLTADDRTAMAIYLKSLPPMEGVPRPDK